MNSVLKTPCKTKDTESGSSSDEWSLKFTASSLPGWKICLEDTYISKLNVVRTKADLPISIFGVFDGHGGKQVARFLQRNFIYELLENSHFKTNNYTTALEETFVKMDTLLRSPQGQQELFQLQGNKTEELGCGSTATVALLIGKSELYVAHVGDSRCYITNDWKLQALTNDHRPNDTNERERIVAAEGEIQNGRVDDLINISRSIGDLKFKNNKDLPQSKQKLISLPEVKKIELTDKNEVILLGSSGFWQAEPTTEKHLERIKDLYAIEKDTVRTVERYLDSAIGKSSGGIGNDNMTLILVDLNANVNDLS
jgi:protein phosphatase 1G